MIDSEYEERIQSAQDSVVLAMVAPGEPSSAAYVRCYEKEQLTTQQIRLLVGRSGKVNWKESPVRDGTKEGE